MIILVGLGNPGEKYARHRHNVGFMAVDAIADRFGFSPERARFSGLIREGSFPKGAPGEKIIVLKPTTFMNESGRAVGEAMRFYKATADQVIVFHDELDIAPDKVKLKAGGGNAGHNGLKSISAHIGNEFRRVRIGIGHPGDKDRVSAYVLGNFAKADGQWLEPLLEHMAQAAPMLTKDDKSFLNELGRLTQGPKAAAKPVAKSAPQQAKAHGAAPAPASGAKAEGSPAANAFAALKGLFTGKSVDDKSDDQKSGAGKARELKAGPQKDRE